MEFGLTCSPGRPRSLRGSVTVMHTRSLAAGGSGRAAELVGVAQPLASGGRAIFGTAKSTNQRALHLLGCTVL
jgi:hypothetical protein